MIRSRHVLNWLDSRTGIRSVRQHLLDEPIPPGVGWWFVTGSVLLMLIAVQFVTGVTLAMYYVPSPEFAHDTVRYLMERVTFGRIVRGLHWFGASFLVVAAVIHMLRVIAFGSYKKPREVTWITGVVMLLIILAFALTGYLLPWDQKAYWATTVTIAIARNGPLGESVAGLLQGGATLGSLTLVRWYATHVFLLPATLVVFVVAHLYLMRRHGISGAVRPREGRPSPFYPHHALKDTIASAAVFSLLLALSLFVHAPLDAVANPLDATYVPRPEWYFLGLFQLLKYFPGRLEPIATMVIPGLMVLFLLLLPFWDRSPHRHPARRPLTMGAVVVLVLSVVTLTFLGYRDTPAYADRASWTPLSIAGGEFVNDPKCVRCHQTDRTVRPVRELRPRHDPSWVIAHTRDPEIIAPGSRPPVGSGLGVGQAQAVGAYVRWLRSGSAEPTISAQERRASITLGQHCAACHTIDGEGTSVGPDLTHIGKERDARWLREWIRNPEAVDPFANMPAFGAELSTTELDVLVAFLAARR